MLTIRQIRRKIVAAQKTKQITRTMQMVAASRVKKAEGRLQQAKPYANKLEELLLRLSSTGQFSHPFFETRDVKNIGLVIVTGDRGLCGSYNANVILKAESFLRSQDKNVKIFPIGKKGFDYFRKKKWEILYKISLKLTSSEYLRNCYQSMSLPRYIYHWHSRLHQRMHQGCWQ